MQKALADKPPIPFRVPPGLNFIPIDRRTGLRAEAGDQGVILEAFKPGTGAARHLLDHRLHRHDGPPADGRAGVGPRRDLGNRRAVLILLSCHCREGGNPITAAAMLFAAVGGC